MGSLLLPFLPIAADLDLAGLLWQPEIGDEVSHRRDMKQVSVLVDPQGMTPGELRETYLWLPSVEQMVQQVEARNSILFHAGLELTEVSLCYKTVIQAPGGAIEATAQTLRAAIGKALCDLLVNRSLGNVH